MPVSSLKKVWQKVQARLSSSASLKATAMLIFWMLASRALGIFRTALVGRLPTTEADIFNSGLILQSNIITVFILGSIVIATLPQISKLESSKSKGQSSKMGEGDLVVAANFNSPLDSVNTDKILCFAQDDKSGVQDDYSVITETKSQGIAAQARNDTLKNFSPSSIYLSWCILILSGSMTLLCGLLIIFAQPVLKFFNPELVVNLTQTGKIQDFILFNQIALVGPIVFGIKSLLGVFLNVKKEYFIYSLEGILNNFGSLLGLTIGYSLFGIVGASIGALSGLVFALIGFLWDSYRFGFRFYLGWFEGLDGYLWQTLWLYLPRLLVYSNIRAAETMVSAISTEANGQISAFQYALDIQGIFLGVIMAVGTVFLPNLASLLVQKGKDKVFWNHLFKYLKISFWLSLVGAIITALGTPLALLFFQFLSQAKKTSFLADPANLQLVSTLAIFAAVALVFQSIAEILNRYFTAVEKVWQSVIASLAGNILAVILALFIKDSGLGAGLVSAICLVLNTVVFTGVLAWFTYWDWRETKA
jgi:hypothetical protein